MNRNEWLEAIRQRIDDHETKNRYLTPKRDALVNDITDMVMDAVVDYEQAQKLTEDLATTRGQIEATLKIVGQAEDNMREVGKILEQDS